MPKTNLTRPPHAWGYCRASDERQKITNDAQEGQILPYYEAKLKPQNVALGGCFKDAAQSGTLPWRERRMGRLLFEAVQPGDHILVAIHDRAFRSMKDAVITIEDLIELEIKVHLLNINLDLSEPMGMAMFHVSMAFAQLDRGMISKRTKEALQWKKGRGLPHCGTAPAGWMKVGKKRDSRYVPNPRQRAAGYFVVECHQRGIAWEAIPGVLRRKGYRRSDLQHNGGFARKNLADEISVTAARNLYAAAKAGFPLANGGRKHCFDWEPALWKSWGIPYEHTRVE